MKYVPTIGLEIHAELKTQSKMFCSCINDFDEGSPNTNVCPICLGHPGTLPTINKEAVAHILRVGSALKGEAGERSKFDRKSYFYPDLPKGYQISQYDMPFINGGSLVGVEIERVHLEEDTARSTHTKGGSLVDFNRAGLPLMELVTKPVIGSADKALEFAKELQLTLRYLGASDADMEKGQMRVEANISLSPKKILGKKKLGTKVELKNINSFKAVKDAIASEIERQSKILDGGGGVVQETRGWDESKKESFSQRVKEEADDYRYMPEPDLPPVDFGAEHGIDIAEIKRSVPELPWEKRERFVREYGLSEGSDELERLIKDRGEAEFFEEVMSEMGGADESTTSLVINYIDSDLVGIIKSGKVSWSDMKITGENFAELIQMVGRGVVNSNTAKQVLREMFATGEDPSHIVSRLDLSQVSDEGAIAEVVGKVLTDNSKAVEDYKKGKETALKFLVGQTMRELRGRGNPELVEKLLLERLSS